MGYVSLPMANLLNFWGFEIFSRENKPFIFFIFKGPKWLSDVTHEKKSLDEAKKNNLRHVLFDTKGRSRYDAQSLKQGATESYLANG